MIIKEEFLKAKNIVYQYAKQVDLFKENGKIPFGSKYLFALIPREDRELNKAIANHYGYFWCECEICGEFYAGFEWLDEHVIRIKGKHGQGVCYKKNVV
jgi:hypothetical protein